MVKKQSTFSRSLANEAKLGAYYTDLTQCACIRKLLQFSEDKPTCVLEPSIGDGQACLTVTRGANTVLFGVELNQETAQSTTEALGDSLEKCLCADFLSGVQISNKVFSFVFSNPPYGTNTEGDRLETLFLEKLYNYIRQQGVLVWVVPKYVLEDPAHQRCLLSRFRVEKLYRFQDPVYGQFQQCVLIGRAKQQFGHHKEDLAVFQQQIASMQVLPDDGDGSVVEVPPSSPDNIKLFATLEFAERRAADYVRDGSLQSLQQELFQIKPFCTEILQPPIQLKDGLKNLLLVSGHGCGAIGSKDKGTYHLQRGVAKVVERVQVVNTGDSMVENVQTETMVVQTIIEANGEIRQLA